MSRMELHPAFTRRAIVRTAAGAAFAGVAGLDVAGRQAARAADQGDAADTLVIAAPGDRYSAEMPLPNIAMSIPNPNVFETLVTLSSEFEVVPALAESWEFVEPNTWRFTLRKDVSFHDGTPFTADAVAWTMARVAAAGGRTLGVDEKSTVVIDDHTVEITPATENRRLPLQLSAPRTGAIIAPGTDVREVRIGTGPFREVEYVRDERYLVEAFDGYWGQPAKVSRIDFRFMPDPTSRVLALEAGEVDLVYDVPREAAAGLGDTDGFQIVTSGVGAYQAISINIHGAAPYDLGQDPAVREAVALAIDRQAIIDVAWQGYAQPDTTMVPAAVLGASAADVPGVPFDPEGAKAVLEQAGWITGEDGIRARDGRRLEMVMVSGYPTAEIQGSMPELVQAQLREVGIDLAIVTAPDSGVYADLLVAREGDLWAEVGNQVDADPCYLPGSLYSSPNPDLDDESNSYANAFAPGAAFDAAIAECGAAASTEGVQQAAAKAMSIITADHVVLPLAGIQRIYGLSDRVEGFVAHPVQFLQPWDAVSLAKA